MEERWQAYNEQGEPTGDGLTKAQARSGILHGASHVWMYRKTPDTIEILLQKRAEGKLTWPGFLDVSAAGHIDHGEAPLNAALRETHEELGLFVAKEELHLLFVFHQTMHDEISGAIENEFQWVYGLEVTPATAFAFDAEVASVRWLTITQLQAMVAGQNPEEQVVPHGEVYFANLLTSLGTMARHTDSNL